MKNIQRSKYFYLGNDSAFDRSEWIGRQINDERALLRFLVNKEDYEKAAIVRDRIKYLELLSKLIIN